MDQEIFVSVIILQYISLISFILFSVDVNTQKVESQDALRTKKPTPKEEKKSSKHEMGKTAATLLAKAKGITTEPAKLKGVLVHELSVVRHFEVLSHGATSYEGRLKSS